MSDKLIGRKEEQAILNEAFHSGRPEMVAVFGRRRVGKTFLIKQTYQPHIAFELAGLQSSNNKEQLQNFSNQLKRFSQSPVPVKTPTNWLDAFFTLAQFLDQQPTDKKRVIFFDEVPWLAGNKSGFITGLGWFWNSWAEMRNVVVVICGSAASWMIQKIVNDRGGLHNRITKRVFLDPFTLSETETYLQSHHIFYNRYQIIQIYMALGGIPHYLNEIKAGKSAIQNINDICFSKNGLLRDEFSRLYAALFAHADNHIAVVRALAQSRQGLTRSAIIKIAQLSEGGNTSKVLEELEQSGFITSYYPFDKRKKDMLYRLTDEYSLFYLRFIEHNKDSGSETWNQLSQTPSAKVWSGYAYENTCLKHLPNIKKALGISGVYTQSSTFLHKGNGEEKGAQIDLVLDRNDQIINLFEIKFYNTEFTLSESDAKVLRNQMWTFKEKTKTKKHLMIVLLTTFGMPHNMHSLGLVEKILTMDDLFL
jgi:AAA+ ATPase superfamily predicted ATPase